MLTNQGATAPAILFSQLSPDLTHEVPLGLEGLPTEIEVTIGTEKKKLPVAYFEKDVIECGAFKHPTTGQEFSVDTHRLDRWVTKFDQMRAAGVEIPCPIDHSDKAEDNRGFTLKMRRDGNKLKVTPQVFGEDGALMALRNRCSVKIEPDFVDERGRHWGECISHVAFTPIPVISGQGPFVPIAASRGQQSVPVYYLSASKGSEMDLSKIREAIGAKAEVTDEKVLELALSKLTEGQKAATDLVAANTELSRVKEQVVTLSREPKAEDPEILADRAELYLSKIDLATERGEIPLSIAKKIKARVVRDNKPVAFMLSRQADIGARPVDDLLSLFAGEKLGIATGEVTNLQLNREVPDDDKPKPITEDRLKELKAMAGLPTK